MSSRAWMLAGSIVCAAIAGQVGCGGDSNVGGGGAGASGGNGGTAGMGGTPGTTTTTSTSGGGTSSEVGGAGGTGGAGGGATVADACPGTAESIGIGTLTLTGSTTGLKDDYQISTGKCVGGAVATGPDGVYAVTFTKSATVTATLTGAAGYDAVFYAEKTCGDNTSATFCENDMSMGSESQTFPVDPNTTLFFIVDGQNGSSGDFTLKIDAAAPHCGDGYVNTGEECDDGNMTSGDGCSAMCKKEKADTSDTCPGDVVPLPVGTLELKGMMATALIGEATTGNYKDDYITCDGIVQDNPQGHGPPDQNGNDRVFQVIPAATGTMHVELRNIGSAGGFDGMLSAYKDTCGFDATHGPGPALAFNDTTLTDAASGNYLGCSDQVDGATAYSDDPTQFETLTDFPVNAGESIFVVIDGYRGSSDGEFDLVLQLTVP